MEVLNKDDVLNIIVPTKLQFAWLCAASKWTRNRVISSRFEVYYCCMQSEHEGE